jgi:hypothetical protein
MDSLSRPILQVYDATKLDCPVILSVRCIRDGQVYEHYEAYPAASIKGFTLSQVGTHLQRSVYEALRRAYADAINERNSIGPVEEN